MAHARRLKILLESEEQETWAANAQPALLLPDSTVVTDVPRRTGPGPSRRRPECRPARTRQ